MKAEDPISKKYYYFVDKCLPFGASISCAVFQAFSDALAHIMEVWTERNSLTNYLDDFLFFALTKLLCDQRVAKFLQLCEQIGCPVAEEKMEWGSMTIIFLGILLDGVHMILSIPLDKKIKAINLLKFTQGRKTVTIKDLQKLMGTLNFLCKAIFTGCTFLRCFYDKMVTSDGTELKQYHHVRTSTEMKQDCEVWISFLEHYNDNITMCRPFVDLNVFETSETLNFYTDSSANSRLGFGCIFNNRWMFEQWEPGYIDNHNPSIEYLRASCSLYHCRDLGAFADKHQSSHFLRQSSSSSHGE